jgi:peptide/nickel transport system substrate-binding protein
VVVKLRSDNADFPFIFTERAIPIMPDKDGEPDWQSGVGAGAYILQSFEPGVRAFLKKNPNYWKPNRGHFDEVELLSIADVTARTNALTSKQVDVISRCDVKTVDLLKKRPGIRVEEVVGTKHYYLVMRCDTPPFDDNNIRLALKHAIDRKEILKKILLNHGMVGNDHPIAPSNRFYAKDLQQREYDPEKAKYYLKKASRDNLKVDLHTAETAFPGAVDTGILFREHAKAANIEVNVIREPKDGYWTNVWMKKPFTMSYSSGRPTEDWAFGMFYARDASWNESYWDNDRFNKLLVEARTELDPNRRGEMYYEMQQLVRDDAGNLIPMFANHIWALQEKVQHADKVAANEPLDAARLLERWWFA